ncbi:MAG TPA: Dabb family protein [Bryobacteraceae bacterium]|nr:Dabb family protein [Bryobacteraceae bacterium]
MKRFTLAFLSLAVVAAGLLFAANAFNAPSTILHIVVVKWKADSTPQQQQAAIDGLRKMAADVPGIKNVWVKKVKVQPADYNTSFAIEFENKAAFDAYTNSPAHKTWEKLYLPYREESNTQDITN